MCVFTCVQARTGSVPRDETVYPSLLYSERLWPAERPAMLLPSPSSQWTDSGHLRLISHTKVGQVQCELPLLDLSEARGEA